MNHIYILYKTDFWGQPKKVIAYCSSFRKAIAIAIQISKDNKFNWNKENNYQYDTNKQISIAKKKLDVL